mmetsp:Transcript_14184/g.31008  ORF Transcript_14184/g.31008 Transcript_14184/m.31008 type:complete len:335 (+) Transcript_14184:218-1222(+)
MQLAGVAEPGMGGFHSLSFPFVVADDADASHVVVEVPAGRGSVSVEVDHDAAAAGEEVEKGGGEALRVGGGGGGHDNDNGLAGRSAILRRGGRVQPSANIFQVVDQIRFGAGFVPGGGLVPHPAIHPFPGGALDVVHHHVLAPSDGDVTLLSDNVHSIGRPLHLRRHGRRGRVQNPYAPRGPLPDGSVVFVVPVLGRADRGHEPRPQPRRQGGLQPFPRQILLAVHRRGSSFRRGFHFVVAVAPANVHEAVFAEEAHVRGGEDDGAARGTSRRKTAAAGRQHVGRRVRRRRGDGDRVGGAGPRPIDGVFGTETLAGGDVQAFVGRGALGTSGAV